jgi:large subunit ribosomal protein L23
MKSFIDLIKYPILTEKAVRLFKQNQYSFAVSKKATKPLIKAAIETLFDVKVISVNTSTQQRKKAPSW